jgi:hypothetical protein
MSLRFYRRVSLLPGLRLNCSRSGVSMSVGARGTWLTVGGPRGRRMTVGLPGTGLSYTETYPPALPVHGGHQLLFALVVVVLVAAVWWAAHG